MANLSYIKPIQEGFVPITRRKMVREYVETPLVDTAEMLYDYNICTVWSSCNQKDNEGDVGIGIAYEKLSDENKQIAKALAERYPDIVSIGKNTHYLGFTNDKGEQDGELAVVIGFDSHKQFESIEDLSRAFKEIAKTFKLQDVMWGQNTTENLTKYFGEEVDVPFELTDEEYEKYSEQIMEGTLPQEIFDMLQERRGETRQRILAENPDYVLVTKFGVETVVKPLSVEEILEAFPNSVWDEEKKVFWESKELYEKHLAFQKGQIRESTVAFDNLVDSLAPIEDDDQRIDALMRHYIDNVEYDYGKFYAIKACTFGGQGHYNEIDAIGEKYDKDNVYDRGMALEEIRGLGYPQELIDRIVRYYGVPHTIPATTDKVVFGQVIKGEPERVITHGLMGSLQKICLEPPHVVDGLVKKGVCADFVNEIVEICHDLGIMSAEKVDGFTSVNHVWNEIEGDQYDVTYAKFAMDGFPYMERREGVEAKDWLGVSLAKMASEQPSRKIDVDGSLVRIADVLGRQKGLDSD